MITLLLFCIVVASGVQAFSPKLWKGPRVSLTPMMASSPGDSTSIPSSSLDVDRSSTTKVLGVFSSAVVGIFGAQKAANAANMKKGEYLREPTSAFKEEVAATKAMNARQIKEREKWDTLFTKFENSKTSEELEASLKALIAYLKSLDGVPTGFSKMELVKRCRARRNDETKKKRKPVPKEEWTTPVEVQYQLLIQVWNKAMTPERESDKMAF